jgi:hypothetical protein
MGAEPVDLTLVVRECDAMLAADIEARRRRAGLSELPVAGATPSSWPPSSGTCS